MKRMLRILLALCLICGLAVLPVGAALAAPAAEWATTRLSDPASGVGVQVETQGGALDWHLYVSQPLPSGYLVLLTTGDGRTAEQAAEAVPVRLTVTVPDEPWVYHALPGEPAVAGPEGIASYGLVGMAVDDLIVLNGASVGWAAPAGWLPDAYWMRHARGDAAVMEEPGAETRAEGGRTWAERLHTPAEDGQTWAIGPHTQAAAEPDGTGRAGPADGVQTPTAADLDGRASAEPSFSAASRGQNAGPWDDDANPNTGL